MSRVHTSPRERGLRLKTDEATVRVSRNDTHESPDEHDPADRYPEQRPGGCRLRLTR